MTFHVGMKVVCVNDDFSPEWNQPAINRLPKRGAVYTVRKVGVFFFRTDGYLPTIWLDEIINPTAKWNLSGDVDEIGFWTNRFRPLIERKQSISFTMGAPLDSEKWDNRKKVEVRV